MCIRDSSKIIFRCFLILMYIPLLRYVDKLITQKIYCCFTPHIYFTVKQSFEPLCLLSIGNHRRSNTTALVRNSLKPLIMCAFRHGHRFYPITHCIYLQGFNLIFVFFGCVRSHNYIVYRIHKIIRGI